MCKHMFKDKFIFPIHPGEPPAVPYVVLDIRQLDGIDAKEKVACPML